MYTSDKINLVNNKPFETIKDASIFIGTSRSTVINILDRHIAMSKGFYCYSKPLSFEEKLELKNKGILRDSISSLSISVWVYTSDLNLVNDEPFKSQQEMLKTLNLKRVRTINKYKDTGICFKVFYFFSEKPSSEVVWDIKDNKIYAKPHVKSILVWVYKNNLLINNSPFLSLTSAGTELKIDRKFIIKLLDTEISYKDLYFYSKSKPNST